MWHWSFATAQARQASMPEHAAASRLIRIGRHWKLHPPSARVSAPRNSLPPCLVIQTAPRPWFARSRTACWFPPPWKALDYWIFNPVIHSSCAPCRVGVHFLMNGSFPCFQAGLPMLPVTTCWIPPLLQLPTYGSQRRSGRIRLRTGDMKANPAPRLSNASRWKPVRRFCQPPLSGKNKRDIRCGRWFFSAPRRFADSVSRESPAKTPCGSLWENLLPNAKLS